VLGQEDLFPNEGYEFPQTTETKQTRTYKISEESPFSCTRPLKMVYEQTADRFLARNALAAAGEEYTNTKAAYRATKTPIDGELRPCTSKAVIEVVKKEREIQDRVAEELKLARMQDEAYWCDVEHDEELGTLQIQKDLITRHRRGQRLLADNYRQQFEEHAREVEEERLEDQREAEKIRLAEVEAVHAEEKKQEQLRLVAKERAREFAFRNDQLLQRKGNRIEEELAAEKVVQAQSAEVAARMEAREQAEKEKRDAKTRSREKLIARQAKAYAELIARQAQSDSVAASELARRQELERTQRDEKANQMRRERNEEWLQTQRKRDMRMTDVEDVPDWDNHDDDEMKAQEAYWRRARRRDLQNVHRMQIQDRKDAEDLEVQERRAQYDTMYFLPDNEW
jgi:hypothetical protein